MPGHAADCNLLFGILALQMDFIKRDDLIAGMGSWALAKQRPLGEILVEAGTLTAKRRVLLESLVEEHVEEHGGDPIASLNALGTIDSTASAIRNAVPDPDILASIAHVPSDSQDDAHATRAPSTVDFAPAAVRYRKLRDHAKGGLGIVSVAQDVELKREVALKEIQDRFADDPISQARFVLEAEITGSLEHPGIVPVYGLGTYDDGRPFYAMRLIKGDSLKEAITAFHADEKSNKDPGSRSIALQKLLRRFLDVCNAMSYAHSRGVIHRDLKPDNVMVGPFGETLVVDWGLAKAVGRSCEDGVGPLPESTVLFTTSNCTAETLPGSVIGTPAYMPPEQATGSLDLIGPLSDVYSLGATLYTLLTGKVPFSGRDQLEVLRKVEKGEFIRPRAASPELRKALEAICLKAMALRPADRYDSPSVLADDIEHWLADEPVAAYRESLPERLWRWWQKHPVAATSIMFFVIYVLRGASLLLLPTALIGQPHYWAPFIALAIIGVIIGSIISTILGFAEVKTPARYSIAIRTALRRGFKATIFGGLAAGCVCALLEPVWIVWKNRPSEHADILPKSFLFLMPLFFIPIIWSAMRFSRK